MRPKSAFTPKLTQASDDYNSHVDALLAELSAQGVSDDSMIDLIPALSLTESLNPDDSNNRIGRFSIQPAVDTGQFE